MLDWIESSAGWIAGVGGGGTVLLVAGRWVFKRARAFARKWDSAREVLVGREEIKHPDSGRVLVPATPGLGKRIATMEETLVAIGDTRQEMQQLGEKVGQLTTHLEQHISESNELELARTRERADMWHAIQAVATPPPWDGTDRRAHPAEGGTTNG